MPDDFLEFKRMLEAVVTQIAQMNEKIASLTTYVQTEGLRCPYREKIALAEARETRVSSLEAKYLEMHAKVVLSGAAAGIIFAVATSLIVSAMQR